MTVYEESGRRRQWAFDETLERDQMDRATVNEIRQYTEEYGGKVVEFDLDGSFGTPRKSNFVFGWNGPFVVYVRCVGNYKVDENFGCEVEVEPPPELKKLRHLRTVWTTRYSGNLAWLSELEALEKIGIGSSPGVNEGFPKFFRSVSSVQKLVLGYSAISVDYIPDSVKAMTELRKIWILSNRSQKKPIFLSQGVPSR